MLSLNLKVGREREMQFNTAGGSEFQVRTTGNYSTRNAAVYNSKKNFWSSSRQVCTDLSLPASGALNVSRN